MTEIEKIFRKAIGCDACFTYQGSTLQRGLVDKAQLRPIGEKYWTSNIRIVLVLLNPGAGKVAHAGRNEIFNSLLHGYADGSGELKSVFQHQLDVMPTWGSGQFRRLYLEGYGLELSKIATANVAWCAERDDSYKAMLAPCFDRHTLPLLCALQPDVVLLAGTEAQVFREEIQKACPEVEVVPVMHYRAFNYLQQAAKQGHLKDVRDQLDRIRVARCGCPPTVVPQATNQSGKTNTKPRISTRVQPSNERLAELESKWYSLGIEDQFYRVHHSQKKRETLYGFVKYCDGKEIKEQNIQTLDRALDVARRVEGGLKFVVALQESLVAFPVIKM